jgi:hypothetical protein
MPRQARLDAADTLHHVMGRGLERRRIVQEDPDRTDVVARVAPFDRLVAQVMAAPPYAEARRVFWIVDWKRHLRTGQLSPGRAWTAPASNWSS